MMKLFLFLLLALGFLPSAVPAAESPARTLVARDQGYFPVALRLIDGRIAAVMRGGAPHLGIRGRIDIVFSSDEGLTWTAPSVVVDGPLDDRNPAFGQAADGALVVGFWENSLYDTQGRYSPNDTNKMTRTLVTRSIDGGQSWLPPIAIDFPGLTIASPYGKMLTLPDKTMLMAVYGAPIGQRRDGSFLFRSTDDGRTWKQYSTIATNGFNETGLVRSTNGTILAALRHEKRAGPEGENIWIARSTDNGRTWSAPKSLTPDKVHPGDLGFGPDGSAILFAGDRRGPFGVVALTGDMQGNFDWDTHKSVLNDCTNSDCGYPSGVLLKDGSFLVFYYSIGSSTHQDWGVHCGAVLLRTSR